MWQLKSKYKHMKKLKSLILLSKTIFGIVLVISILSSLVFSCAEKQLTDITPPKPSTLVSPSEADTIYGNEVTLKWTNAIDRSDIQGYELVYYKDYYEGYGYDSTFISLKDTTTSYTIPTALLNGYYRWKLRATDRAGNTNDFGSEQSFYVKSSDPISTIENYKPVTVSPKTGRIIPFKDVTLKWKFPYKRSDIESFVLIFGDIKYDNITDTTFTFTDTLPEGRYKWKVLAVDKNGHSYGYCETDSFSTSALDNFKPILISPISTFTELTGDTVKFTWQYTGEEDKTYTYTLNLNGTEYTGITSTSFTLTDKLNVGIYEWKVKAIDNEGKSYGYGVPKSFLVSELPILISPISTLYELTGYAVKFTWQYTGDPNKTYTYVLNVNGTEYTGITSTSFTLTDKLPGGNYEWKVKAIDNNGETFGYSKPKYFIVETMANALTGGSVKITANLNRYPGAWFKAFCYTCFVVKIERNAEGNIIQEKKFRETDTKQGGSWSPITAMGDKETFVKTIQMNALNYMEMQKYWLNMSKENVIGPSGNVQLNSRVDGWTGASLVDDPSSSSMMMKKDLVKTWDLKDNNGNVVSPGEYKIYLEYTELNTEGPRCFILIKLNNKPLTYSKVDAIVPKVTDPNSWGLNKRSNFNKFDVVYTPN